MKTNRQNQYPRSLRSAHHPPTHPYHSQPQQLTTREKATLASLLTNINQNEVIKLVCMGQVAVHIQTREVTRRDRNKYSRHESKTIVASGMGIKNVLLQTLNSYEMHPEKNYVFSAKIKQQVTYKYFSQNGQKDKNYQNLSKTASQTSIKQFNSSKKSSAQKPNSNLTLQSQTCLPEGKDKFRKIFSNRNLLQKDLMFTVQELKQSLQSDARQSLKSNQQKQNRNGFNFDNLNVEAQNITKNYLDKLNKQQFKKQIQKQNNCQFQAIETIPTKQQHKNQPSNTSIENINQRHPTATATPNQLNSNTNLQALSPDSRFSFNSHIIKGLIQNNNCSYAEPQISFKIAGDHSIQDQRKKAKQEQPSYQMSQIDQFSSITSNVRQDVSKKQNDQQINSIKNDLEDINKCCRPQSNMQKPAEVIPIERMYLNSIAENRQEQADDQIQITQQAVKETQKTQFFVRHNVRFLDHKSDKTQVVRLSPLRFRKKEEVVHQFVKAKLVSKESDSINIP